MSIYATLWRLKFPRYGDAFTRCEWIEVYAQGVPAFVGSPWPGYGYESGDPYAHFLPPAPEGDPEAPGQVLRAVVFVTEETLKGTGRSPQEYVDPLLVLSGSWYAGMSFAELHALLCEALRGNRPRLIGEAWSPDGAVQLLFEDGSVEGMSAR
jgi:hypothetical protein